MFILSRCLLPYFMLVVGWAEIINHHGEHRRYTEYTQTIQCYSCISKRLEINWEFLNSFYRAPVAFTDYCDKDVFQGELVPARNCSNYCVWISGSIQTYGQIIPVSIRGCLSDLIGYRQHAVAQLKATTSCMSIHLIDLYEHSERKFHVNEKVTLCACRTSYCNGIPPKPAHLGTGKLIQYGSNYNIEDNRYRVLSCHSCMSRRLEAANWSSLWRYFRRPEAFSETCRPNEYIRTRPKARTCSDYCVWVETKVAHKGSYMPIHARGCMSDIVNYRQESVVELRRKNACIDISYSDLYKNDNQDGGGGGGNKVNEMLRICSCHTSYCNKSPIPSGARSDRFMCMWWLWWVMCVVIVRSIV